jgi:hypothetical protein
MKRSWRHCGACDHLWWGAENDETPASNEVSPGDAKDAASPKESRQAEGEEEGDEEALVGEAGSFLWHVVVPSGGLGVFCLLPRMIAGSAVVQPVRPSAPEQQERIAHALDSLAPRAGRVVVQRAAIVAAIISGAIPQMGCERTNYGSSRKLLQFGVPGDLTVSGYYTT